MRQTRVFCMTLLAIAVAAGCAKKPDDAALVTNIKSQMFSDSQLKDSSLQVTSNGGVVTLSGTAASDTARYEAYKIATQTPGVAKISDQMTVQQAQAPQPQAAPIPPPASAKQAEAPRKAKPHNYDKPAEHIQLADDSQPTIPQQQYQPPPDQPLPPVSTQPAPAPTPPPPPHLRNQNR